MKAVPFFFPNVFLPNVVSEKNLYCVQIFFCNLQANWSPVGQSRECQEREELSSASSRLILKHKWSHAGKHFCTFLRIMNIIQCSCCASMPIPLLRHWIWPLFGMLCVLKTCTGNLCTWLYKMFQLAMISHVAQHSAIVITASCAAGSYVKTSQDGGSWAWVLG